MNQEFIQLLRAISGNPTERIHADVVQLTLETPIEELFLQLSEAKSAHTNYNIQLDTKSRRGRTSRTTPDQNPTSNDGSPNFSASASRAASRPSARPGLCWM